MQKIFSFLFISILSFSFVQALGDVSTIVTNTSTQCTPVFLSKNLSKGQSDAVLNGDIFLLQTFLNDKGFFLIEPQQYATFGKVTLNAVTVFQGQRYSNVSISDIDTNLIPSLADRQTLAGNGFVLDQTGNVFNYTRAKIAYASCHTNTLNNNTQTIINTQTNTSSINTTSQTISNSNIQSTKVLSTSKFSCIIASGEGTCSIPFTWNINNAISALIVNTSTVPPTTYSYAASGDNVPLAIPSGNNIIQAKDNSTILDYVSVLATCASGTLWNTTTSRCVPTSSTSIDTTQVTSVAPSTQTISVATTTQNQVITTAVPTITANSVLYSSSFTVVPTVNTTNEIVTADSGVVGMYNFPVVAKCPANKFITNTIGSYSMINGNTGFFTPTINSTKTEASGGTGYSSRIIAQCQGTITNQSSPLVTSTTTTTTKISNVATSTSNVVSTTSTPLCNSEQTLVNGVCKTITISFTCPSGKVIQVGGLLSPENKLNQCPIVAVTSIKTQGDYYNSLDATQKASIDKYFLDQFISNPKISMTLGDVIRTDADRGVVRSLIIPVTSIKTYGDYYYSLTQTQKEQLYKEANRFNVITGNSQTAMSQATVTQLDLNWGIARTITATLTSSVTSCDIPLGKSTCTISFTWDNSNSTSPNIYNGTTKTQYSTIAKFSTPSPLAITQGKNTIQARNGENVITSSDVTGNCAAGTVWNSLMCITPAPTQTVCTIPVIKTFGDYYNSLTTTEKSAMSPEQKQGFLNSYNLIMILSTQTLYDTWYRVKPLSSFCTALNIPSSSVKQYVVGGVSFNITAPATCKTLVPISKGSWDNNSNGSVSVLQKFLANKYNLNVKDFVTGYYGDMTVEIVKKFQTENGIEAVGYVGMATKVLIKNQCVN